MQEQSLDLLNNQRVEQYQKKYTSQYCHHILSIHQPKQIQSQPQNHGHLFLGGIQSLKLEVIEQYKISVVFTIMDKPTFDCFKLDTYSEKLKVQHKLIDIEDQNQTHLYEHFQESNRYIDQKLQTGNVLVQCLMGISRSATIVIAFLMWKLKIPYEKAFSYVLSIRDTIGPREIFIEDLKKFDKELGTKKTQK